MDHRSRGNSIDAILDIMGEANVSRGSVAKYVKQYDNLPDAVKALDRSVDWERLEDYGIPWEATCYLLQIWDETDFMYWPTIRDVKWEWRVHQAAPTAPASEVKVGRRQFSHRDRLIDFGLDPKDFGYDDQNFRNLWVRFAARPWEGEEQEKRYREVLASGVIPAYGPGINVRNIQVRLPYRSEQ